MADIYDFFLAINLRDLTDAEVAELRWHLGLGPQPPELTIPIDFSEVVVDDNGEQVIVEAPEPQLAQRGAGWKIGGALFAALEPRENGGWALTARQELHPDYYDHVDPLLEWLGTRADHPYVGEDGTDKRGGCGDFVGYERWYEDSTIERLLVIEDFKILRR
ncbi:hypothetical protein amrb99_09780 [Actinomadura sp. RB99]|uniref:hypothetical protein n=1 Tax=Actinomadura sp. RB99 TaxID=2691577 RepID=UPI001683C4D4|nr:hypothetical protein [Actinomadura sp. RB99]MBD2892068.1 hypothetical protein [Actinomadura sp. RB99]